MPIRGDRASSWLACGVAVLLLASPLKLLWTRTGAGWITPFVLWLLFIIVGGWLARARGSDDL